MKVFFAGGEGRQDIFLKMGVKNVLCSYYYIKNGKKRIDLQAYKDAGIKIMIGSGAHTIVVRKKIINNIDPEEYFNSYLEWLSENRNLIDYYVELDIQEIIGLDRVKGWRRQMRDKGLNPIVALHPRVGSPDTEWNEMTSEYNYCAIEGGLPLHYYINKLLVSEKKKVRVHGFAMTKSYEMSKIPFYSVDSTSWLSGSRFGGSYFWLNDKLLQEGPDNKKSRYRFKNQIVKAGLNWIKIENDNNEEVDKMNLLAWRQFSEWAGKKLLCVWEKEHKDKLKPRGKNIGEIRKDPKIEAKRRELVGIAQAGNIKNWKDGHRSRRKELMGVGCDNCFAKEKCQYHQDGGVCIIRKDVKKIVTLTGTRNKEELVYSLIDIYNKNLERFNMNLHFEQRDGGFADKQVTSLARDLFLQAQILNEIVRERGTAPQQVTQISNIISLEGTDVSKEVKKLKDRLDIWDKEIKKENGKKTNTSKEETIIDV